jgi:hypothetical protein
MSHPVTVTDQEIYIQAQYFVHKDFSVSNKELLLDIFATHYSGQPVRIYVHDGENVEFSGFIDFVKYLVTTFDITNVTWEAHGIVDGFANKKLIPGIFVSTGRHIPDFTQDLSNALFVGTVLGRFNPTRLRLAYEIDQAFPGDNYTIFQPRFTEVVRLLHWAVNLYTRELEWLEHKQFAHDIASHHQNGNVDWQPSCTNYPNIWNRYQIEIISETDSMSSFWVTEKTARCLATGKPFVLLAGKDSLNNLRGMGFNTFGDVLNESYDQAKTPTERIHSIIDSLQPLQNNPEAIAELYSIAKTNIEIYKHYAETIRQ